MNALMATMMMLATSGPAPGPATAELETFALIVTNNRSASLERPDLKYADDDGARYHALFSAMAPAQNLELLTRFDAASKLTHPQLDAIARPPTRSEVRAAVARIGASVAQARRAGRKPAFYFVFAGHGDVDQGKGFLELEDGRLDADFLEHEIIEAIPATTLHIVLDSCNSFFVINPRKPGGRRWATPADLTEGFSKRHPEVGVLLSTNALAEVYEWSELESGIFSYEVWSGLTGAADVDHDGVVSYDELAGYIDTANRDIPNDQIRPRVFSRGPGGRGDAPLFTAAGLRGRRIVVGDGPHRLWVRNDRARRLLDVNKESGGPLSLTIPGAREPLTIYEEVRRSAQDHPTLRTYDVAAGAGDVTNLAALSPSPSAVQARGSDAIFAGLFASPFGPMAYARYLQDRDHAQPAIYGVSRDEERHIQNALAAVATSGRATGAALFDLADAVTAGAATAVQHQTFFTGGTITPPPPAEYGWLDGRVPEGDNAFTVGRNQFRLSVLGRSAVGIRDRLELSTYLPLDVVLFPNLALKYRFFDGDAAAAAFQLGVGAGAYPVAVGFVIPIGAAVGGAGLVGASYQRAGLAFSWRPATSTTFTARGSALAVEIGLLGIGGGIGNGGAGAAPIVGTGSATGASGGLEMDFAVGKHDAIVIDGDVYRFRGSDRSLVVSTAVWTHAWPHVHLTLGALGAFDSDGHKVLPYANVYWTF